MTAERVLVNMDTRAHPELINARFAYVPYLAPRRMPTSTRTVPRISFSIAYSAAMRSIASVVIGEDARRGSRDTCRLGAPKMQPADLPGVVQATESALQSEAAST